MFLKQKCIRMITFIRTYHLKMLEHKIKSCRGARFHCRNAEVVPGGTFFEEEIGLPPFLLLCNRASTKVQFSYGNY